MFSNISIPKFFVKYLTMNYIFTFPFPFSKSNDFIPDCIYLLLNKALKIQPASENLYQREKKVLSVRYSFNSDFQEEFQYSALSTIGSFLPCSPFLCVLEQLNIVFPLSLLIQKMKHRVLAAMNFIQIFLQIQSVVRNHIQLGKYKHLARCHIIEKLIWCLPFVQVFKNGFILS